jgi:hypothetical protein
MGPEAETYNLPPGGEVFENVKEVSLPSGPV